MGWWAPSESTVFDATEENVRNDLKHRGVCGDIAGVLVDTAGRAVSSTMAERMICPTAEQLQAIPEVIAIAYHTVRAPAVKAAVQGGLVDSLVTHTSLAEALLGEA